MNQCKWHIAKLMFGVMAFWSLVAMVQLEQPDFIEWGAVIGGIGYSVCSLKSFNTGE